MTASATAAHRAALIAESDALADLLRQADPATPIPTCPGWSLADLVTHVGRAQRWAATMIAAGATEELDIRAVPDGARPKEPAAAARWLSEAARLALTAIDTADTDAAVWTTLGAPQPVQWWLRRLTHEVIVHRADALLALGRTVAIAPDLAVDAIGEWLDLLRDATARRTTTVLPDTVTLHLHATDPGLGPAGEWAIRPSGPSISWAHEHTEATTVVRGSAAALLLALMGRVRLDDPELAIEGDPAAFAHWLERTPF